jgi:riboflavin synthase
MENILNTTPRFKSIGMLTMNYLVIKNSPMTAIKIIHAGCEYTMMLGIWYKMDRGQASLFACLHQYNYSDKTASSSAC